MKIQITAQLPYRLLLPDGAYDLQEHTSIHLRLIHDGERAGETAKSFTQARAEFEIPDGLDEQQCEDERRRQANRFLGRLNRLLRWYRAVARQADIIELTHSQLSPVRFFIVDTDASWGEVRSAPPVRLPGPEQNPSRIAEAVRRGLKEGAEPDVADLFLLDAEEALHTGRFREAVLFCWSTIDATFNREYDQLVDRKLAGEWADSRDFFKGLDFGLKNKMSAAMYLVAGRSLFREPGDLWKDLSESYKKRNGIIHRGEVAKEEDAKQAIQVASRVVEIMRSIASEANTVHRPGT